MAPLTATQLSCDCGEFKAYISNYPKCSLGTVICYCDDCQKYLHHLKRIDLLDSYGGTELVPIYPHYFSIQSGEDLLQCHRLNPKGLNRWSVSCCSSPIGNTLSKFPWLGLSKKLFLNGDDRNKNILGNVKSRIMGKYKTQNAPFAISNKLAFKDMMIVLPFILKGIIFFKKKNNPFFREDGITPLKKPIILQENESV